MRHPIFRLGWLRCCSADSHRGQKPIRISYRTYGLVAGASFLLAVAGLARDQVLAWRYGLSDIADIFQVAIQVPTFVLTALTSTFGAAFVPTLIAERSRVNGAFSLAVRRFHGHILLLALILCGVLLLFALWGTRWLAPGFDAAKLAWLRLAVALLAIGAGIGVLSSFWSAVLQSKQRFTGAILAGALVPATTAAAMIASPPSVAVPIMGALAGYSFQWLVLLFLVRGEQLPLLPLWGRRQARVSQRAVWAEVTFALLGTLLMALVPVVALAFVSATGSGSTASFAYAGIIVTAVLGFTLKVLGGPLLNIYATYAARDDWRTLRGSVGMHVRYALFMGTLCFAALWMMAGWIVKVLYVRGSFTIEDAGRVQTLLVLLSLQLPWHIAGAFVTRALSAMKANRIIFQAALLNLVVFCGLTILLQPAMGVAAVALALCGMYAVSHCFCWIQFVRIVALRGS